jgi:hypothetical protein
MVQPRKVSSTRSAKLCSRCESLMSFGEKKIASPVVAALGPASRRALCLPLILLMPARSVFNRKH